jgi:hypothetical protein
MRRLILAALLAAPSLANALEVDKTVTVFNDSKAVVKRLFASSTKTEPRDAPGKLVADNLNLQPGASATVKMKTLKSECVFNVRAETTAGDMHAYTVDICSRNASFHIKSE